jgi:L-2-hydroxyglutarate oxidase LhgO
MERIRSDCLIIGGGIAGLAIAKSLVKRYKNIFLIEKNKSLGQEVSSRNSEVIHAGIYYKKDSLKAKLCVEGKKLLYDYLTHRDIPFVKCGKFIVSNSYDETKKLTEIKDNAQECGVEDLEFNNTELKKYPFITFSEALYSPSSGIFDSQRFIMSLKDEFEQDGGIVILGNECLNIEKDSKGLEVTIHDKNTGEKFILETNLLINGAGLNAVKIANELHGEEKFANKFLKGEYYNYQGKEKLDHLIYPIPTKNSLGLHATIDLGKGIRFGPSAYVTQEIEYSHKTSEKELFFKRVQSYWPQIKKEDFVPAYSGIRPNVEGLDDFLIDIKTTVDRSFVNVLGYASPGLTSSLALADYINSKLRSYDI